MKVLQIIPAFYPALSYGGPVAVSYQLTKSLLKRGHNVSVYTSDTLDKTNRQKNKVLDLDGANVYYFRNVSNRLAWYRFIITPGLIIELRENLENFDIVHLHGFRNFHNIIAHYYLKRYKIPYVLEAHGSVPMFAQKQRIKTIYDALWGRKIAKDASRVIALTETEAKDYEMFGVTKDKIIVLPNGLDLSDYEELPRKGQFKATFAIPIDCKVILYVGRIHKSKGLDLLIQAFSRISKEYINCMLVLVGPDDGYRSALDKLVQNLKLSDKILFAGFISKNEKIAAYVDADIFITPSFSGFPITFLEACACGTPIITTNNGDELNWIHDNVGYVVDYDANQLCSAMVKLLKDDRLRGRFGEEGRRLAREEFGWDEIVAKLETIYEDCINNYAYKSA